MSGLNGLQRAIKFSKTLHEVLKKIGFKPCRHEETYFSFRIPIRIPEFPQVAFVFISSYRIYRFNTEPVKVEMALMGSEEYIIDVDELGYPIHEFKLFDNNRDLIKELNHLTNY
jgi:hypothetical protein